MPRTKKTVVILVSGKAGSGKTTVADFLYENLSNKDSLTVFRYGFADPIKFMCEAYAGWNKEKDERGRKLLQQQGQIYREYDENIWVKHFLTQLDRKSGMFPFNFAVIHDWRFPNEHAYLLTNPLLEVVTIRVFGRGGLDGEIALDVSENSLPEVTADGFTWSYDFTVDNSGSIEQLNEKLEALLDSIERKYIIE